MAEKTKLGLGTETMSDVGTGDTWLGDSDSRAPHSTGPRPRTSEDDEVVRGDVIGRFVVLELLGTGGMGLVYSAYDPQLDRKVAIKLLRRSVLTSAESGRTRLLREAQAMAKINDPHVVKVHEVGTHDGQVYVAMEFVDGGTLRTWVQRKPGMRAVLEVFAQAGAGLAAAHAVGLVHRDFKPDNVLLASDGGVRVTDFGLVGIAQPTPSGEVPPAEPHDTVKTARAPTEPAASLSGATPLSLNLTRTGSVMGTPSYMAPEQFNGTAATEATDQFAFCVALYEALYGERPFRGTSFAELTMAVTDGEVIAAPKQSTVPGWLRRVLLRGLARAPQDRFPSMVALLGALSRDRTRRHRRRLAWAAGALVLVGAGTVAVAGLRDRGATCDGDSLVARVWTPAARIGLERAFTASGRPHAASSFSSVTSRIDAWGNGWRDAYRDACADHTHPPHVVDLRIQCLSRRLDESAATIDALTAGGSNADVIDYAVDAVVKLPSVGPCSDVAALTAEVEPPETAIARTQVALVHARLDDVHALEHLGRYGAARDTATAAIEMARGTGYRPIIAEALLARGAVAIDLAEPVGIDRAREALHVAAEAGDETAELDAAAMLVGILTRDKARFEQAQEMSDFAAAIAAHAHPRVETALRLTIAGAYLDEQRGKPALAQASYEKAAALAEKELGVESPFASNARNLLGNVLKSEGKLADARAVLERELALREKIYGKDHPDVASSLNNLANVFRVESKLDEALKLYQRALALRIAAFGPNHPEVATSYNNLGTLYGESDDYIDAQPYYEKALAIWENVYGRDNVNVATAVVNVGDALSEQGKYVEARAHFERAIALYTHAHGPDDVHLADIESNLALIDEKEGHWDTAISRFERAIALTAKTYGPDHPDIADFEFNEASAIKHLGKLDQAEAMLGKALDVIGRAYGPEHPRMAMGLSNLAALQVSRGNYQEALDTYRRALAIFEAHSGTSSTFASYPLLGIAACLDDLKRPAEALPYLERGLAIREAAKMELTLLAEYHDMIAVVLADAHLDHARALREAELSLHQYEEAKDAANANEVRIWLAKHR